MKGRLWNGTVREVTDLLASQFAGDQTYGMLTDWRVRFGVGDVVGFCEAWVPLISATCFMARH